MKPRTRSADPTAVLPHLSPTKMITSRPFSLADYESCLEMFDANTPDNFAPNERDDYERFIAASPSFYRVCLVEEKVVGAYGIAIDTQKSRGRIRWIMTTVSSRGIGLGRFMMLELLDHAREMGIGFIDIAASQKSASFFEHYGAMEQTREPEGWGPGLDQVTMELKLAGSNIVRPPGAA